MKTIEATEHEEQVAFFDSVEWTYKSCVDFKRLLLFATFNGEIWRSAGKLARAGLTRGVSDILYLQPRGGYAFFTCELKRIGRKGERDGGVTPEELEWMKEARKAGAYVCAAYGADEALQMFGNYMALEVSDSQYITTNSGR